jgi:hypothetical protein
LIDKVVLPLQNCINLLKVVPGLYNEIYLTSSQDGNEVMNTKAEVTDVPEEGDDPVLTTVPVIRAEHKVSCSSVCVLVSKPLTGDAVFLLH